MAWPRKRGLGRVSAAMWARAHSGFGPGVTFLMSFPLVPINTPRGFQFGDIQRRELYYVALLGVVVVVVLLLLVLVLAIRVKERESVCKSCI